MLFVTFLSFVRVICQIWNLIVRTVNCFLIMLFGQLLKLQNDLNRFVEYFKLLGLSLKCFLSVKFWRSTKIDPHQWIPIIWWTPYFYEQIIMHAIDLGSKFSNSMEPDCALIEHILECGSLIWHPHTANGSIPFRV